MFKILVLLVFNVILFSKDFPLERTIDVKINNNTTTVLEFPFVIKDKSFDKFRRIIDKTNENDTNKIDVPTMKKR